MSNKTLKRPVVLLAVLVAVVCFVTLSFPQNSGVVFAIVILLGVGLFTLFYLGKHKLLAVVFLFVLIFCAFISHLSYIRTEQTAGNLIDSLGNRTHTFSAKVEKCTVNTNLSNFTLKIDSVDGVRLDKPLSASAFCFSGDYATEGDILTFQATAYDISEVSMDSFSSFLYLKSHKTFIYLPNISIKSSEPASSLSFIDSCRRNIREIIYRYIPHNYSYTSSFIANALSLGDTSQIPQNLKNSFVISGLTHILSVSGMHVSIIIGFLCVFLSNFPINKKHIFLIACIVCIFYVALTCFQISAVRAGIMSLFMCFSVIFLKRSDSFNSLFTAIILILLFNPYCVFDVSLYLSFFATLGIICSFDFSKRDTANTPKGKKVIMFVTECIKVNLFAVTFTMPINILTFRGVSLAGIFATMCVSFICSVVMILLFVLILCGFIPFLRFLCIPTGFILHYLINFITDISLWFSSFKYSYIPTDKSVYVILVFACLTAILFLSLYRSDLFGFILAKRGIIFLCLCVVIFSLCSFSFEDSRCKISYYRKNFSDRQLSIKTGKDGYLLINADSTLCFDNKKLPFDMYSGKNSLLVIDDKNIDTDILCQNIILFNSRFGLENVFIPQDSCAKLESIIPFLVQSGINCSTFPDVFIRGNTVATLKSANFDSLITVFDGQTSVKICFAQNYNKDMFSGFADICAYFTRNNDGQFLLENDAKPECTVFYTRLGKGLSQSGIINTYGKESFYIKE